MSDCPCRLAILRVCRWSCLSDTLCNTRCTKRCVPPYRL